MGSKICIIGCGWLGFPLAQSLLQKGFKINGSTTSDEKLQDLKIHGILPFLLSFSAEGIIGNLKSCLDNCDTLVLNIPPGLRKNPQQNYVKQMSFLIPSIEASSVKNIIFVSSTSVYEDQESFPLISETSPTSQSNMAKQLLASEALFFKNPHFKTTILRFSGLFGKDRHPAKFLSGKKNIKNPDAPVNLIHLNDCISIIEAIIEKNVWNTICNASTEPHPSKKDYYTSICKQHNLPLPSFDFDAVSIGKIIDASKLAQVLNYEFKIKL